MFRYKKQIISYFTVILEVRKRGRGSRNRGGDNSQEREQAEFLRIYNKKEIKVLK